MKIGEGKLHFLADVNVNTFNLHVYRETVVYL
jgi:hypothetical protein